MRISDWSSDGCSSDLPVADPHADGGDLVLAARPLGGTAVDPDADPAVADLAAQVELCQSGDHPVLHPADEGAHVLSAPVEVQHDIGDALARAVIGELAPPTGLVDRKPRVQQVTLQIGRAHV